MAKPFFAPAGLRCPMTDFLGGAAVSASVTVGAASTGGAASMTGAAGVGVASGARGADGVGLRTTD